MEIKKCPFRGEIGELAMDEKKIFDEYGNYHFPTEKKQEGLNTIEEMELVMHNAWGCRYCNTKAMKLNNDRFFNREATAIYNAGYRKESDTAREILQKVLKFTLDDEVGLRYLIKNLAKEYGVEL